MQKLKKNFSEAEFQELKAAYDFSAAAHEGQKRQTGEPYFIHPCAVVNVLVDLGFDDVSTLVAAFLHDVLEDTQVTADELEQKFGKEVLELVEGVTKLDKIKFVSAEDEQAENLRKMFFAMAKDYRVIIIKLADRLHNMRTLDALKPEKQIKIATQSLKIYAPLAGRLGLSFVKCELEDLAMRYLYPDDYYELVEFIKTKSKERQQFIEKICDELKAKLQELGIEGEVNGRQKHLYGIYKKMLKQGKNIEQIYDISAVRVIVNEVQDCYTVLGAIHTMWMPLPGRFKDYIAVPKTNGYQSLHNTMIGDHGMPFEVQIRTHEMHRVAEFGVAAHYKYKNDGKSTQFDETLNFVHQLMSIDNEVDDTREFMDTLKKELFSDDEVFVFTPQGDAIDLPKDSALRDSLKILNPLGEDTSIMRTTTLPSMLEILTRNYNFRNKSAKLYELGRVYFKRADGLADEPKVLTLGAYGGGMDFFALKGAGEAVLKQLRIENVRFLADTENPSYHPGRCAKVYCGDRLLGTLGQVHPHVAGNYGVDTELYAAELRFDALYESKGAQPVYQPLPKFPAVTRDIAVVCDKAVTVGELEDAIRKGAKGLLKDVALFDIYTGVGIAPGKKSVAFNLTLRSDDRSLTAEEADADVKSILTALEQECGAVLR